MSSEEERANARTGPEYEDMAPEMGVNEGHAAGLYTDTRQWALNSKRTYDEYQQESLESIRRNRSYVDKVLSDAQQNDNFKQNVANQALQNAVETANMVSKNAVRSKEQSIRHADLAIDRQWNLDEQSQLATIVSAVLAELGLVKRQGGIDQKPSS